jgi:hypothetical protein
MSGEELSVYMCKTS